MTKAQQKQIISVIRKDASLRHKYYNPKTGDACVIGGLALSARVPKQVLVKCGVQSIGCSGDCFSRVVESISRKFGLDCRQMRNLQRINDSHNNKRERRIALIREVRMLGLLTHLFCALTAITVPALPVHDAGVTPEPVKVNLE